VFSWNDFLFAGFKRLDCLIPCKYIRSSSLSSDEASDQVDMTN
jgi:hypothetical protein